MKRYWIKLETTEDKHGPRVITSRPIALGIGVTAYNREDALQLIREKIFNNDPIPRVVEVVEDVDISKLDANHVLPNMLPPNRRGIWFPMGYE